MKRMDNETVDVLLPPYQWKFTFGAQFWILPEGRIKLTRKGLQKGSRDGKS